MPELALFLLGMVLGFLIGYKLRRVLRAPEGEAVGHLPINFFWTGDENPHSRGVFTLIQHYDGTRSYKIDGDPYAIREHKGHIAYTHDILPWVEGLKDKV